jgi:hypothetical protein
MYICTWGCVDLVKNYCHSNLRPLEEHQGWLDQYPFATVYDKELGFYSFQQETMSKPQWYEKFNTKVDVGSAIGVTRQHKVLLEYLAQEIRHCQRSKNKWSMRTLKRATSHMPSYIRAEPNMVISRWI